MGRKKRDGTPSKAANKLELTELYVRRVGTESKPFCAWDTNARGLVLKVLPSGHRSFFYVYRDGSRRQRWHHIDVAGLADARRIAVKLRAAVADGKDPAAVRDAERAADTFAAFYEQRYLPRAREKNRSWRQADALVRRHLLPRWGRLPVKGITLEHAEAAFDRIEAPIVANQTLAAASAIFTYAVKKHVIPFNPCTGVERHETKDRERILSDSEIPKFWKAFDAAGEAGRALKVLLLLGQRPGEISMMRHEHVVDNWWTLPGDPIPELNWPGTRNGESNRVWLPTPVRELIGDGTTGAVFPKLQLPKAMRRICEDLGVKIRATPHDLRRTHGSTITGLHFGRDAMNRIQNHKEGGIADVYDRHDYAAENKRVMEAVAAHILALAEGRRAATNVLKFSGALSGDRSSGG